LSAVRVSLNIISAANTISYCFHNSATVPSTARLIRWNNSNYVGTILNVDGSCMGDPIRTGFGGVLRNHSGTYISGFSGFISNSHDILFAELTALYQGLTLAVSLNYEEVVCYSDSLLTVNLINDDYSRYHVYAVLIQNIKDLLSTTNFSLRHSLREGNQCADFMAKLGASTDDAFTIHSSPPELLLPLLRADEIGSLFVRR
jgi:ribonuclease HI